jgi:hypothetical protein
MLLHDWDLLLLVIAFVAVVFWFATRSSGEGWKSSSPPLP